MIDSILQKSFDISHASEISAARRYAQQLAQELGFKETGSGKLAIVVTEAATNILKHAGDGLLLLTPVYKDKCVGIQVLALDRGPGIANLVYSLLDGVSTAGTAGTGLGAMRRLADEFDIYANPGSGTALYMCLWGDTPTGAADDLTPPAEAMMAECIQSGTVCLPVAGEEECGDAWAILPTAHGITVMVADGLGHGPGAALASRTAVDAIIDVSSLPATQLIDAMHQALRATRGAAAAVAKLDIEAHNITFAGIGNISACVIDGDLRKQIPSHNGIVGHNMRKVQEFTTPWPVGALCVMCSDGIATQWDLNLYPGLRACHSTLIAGVLYRDFMRMRDDATVVVIKRLH